MRRYRRPIRWLLVVMLGMGLAAAAVRVPPDVFGQSAPSPVTTRNSPEVATFALKPPDFVPSEAPAPPPPGFPPLDAPRPQTFVLQAPATPEPQPAPPNPAIEEAIKTLRSGGQPATSPPRPTPVRVKPIATAMKSEVPTEGPPTHLVDDAKRDAVDKAVAVLLQKSNQTPPQASTPHVPPIVAQTVPQVVPQTVPLTELPVKTPTRAETEPLGRPRDNSFNPIGRLMDRVRGAPPPPPAEALPAAPPLPPILTADSEEQEPVRSALRSAASQPTLTIDDDVPKSLPPSLPPPPGGSSPKASATPPESPPRAASPPSAPEGVPMESCATCGHRRPLQRLHDKFDGKWGKCTRCGADWRCVPGQQPCGWCEAEGPVGHFFCSIYDSLCCIDPCYEPKWRQVPNAAIFVDGARPITQTEVRWNAMRGGVFPDRAEFIWARADGMGRGPRPLVAGVYGGHLTLDELNIITETAKDKISAIIEFPYRAVSDPAYPHGGGIGDMAIGTKTLLCDCELMQFSIMMKTYFPIGNALKGVGTGHVTIEPSLLFAVKMTDDCYIQGQFSEWIPIGGDPDYAGSVFHTHFSVNNVLYRFGPDFPLVGTFETNTYSFQDGAYTDPILGPYQSASKTTYVSLGPGLRLMFCDKLDVGFGAAIAVSGDHFAREYYRTSVRIRF